MRLPPVSSISIRRSFECAATLRDGTAGDATGSSSATTALTKAVSDLVRFAAKALRQVTSRERDKPYRRAVAATRRGSDRLSKTIRAFSSSDQRRRRPVSTTSSRFSALIVWLSIRTVLNHQTSPPQGVFPRKLTPMFESTRFDKCKDLAPQLLSVLAIGPTADRAFSLQHADLMSRNPL